MKSEICAFSGMRIHPGHGRRFVRSDARTFSFVNTKAMVFFRASKRPRRVAWTVFYRRQHKKGAEAQAVKKRSRKVQKFQRAIVGASIEQIKAKRTQTPAVRQAARDAAKRELKERKAKAKATKKQQKPVQPKVKAPKNVKNKGR